jgi:hypothetical protein
MNESTTVSHARTDDAFTPRRLKLATYNVRTMCNKERKIDNGKLYLLEAGCEANAN